MVISFSKYVLWFVICLLTMSCSNAQEQKLTESKVSFNKIQLLEKYVSEGASIGDIDNDGHTDIVSGVLWWKGPDFEERYAYAPVKYFPITGPGLEGYTDNFFTFPEHFDSDEWMDILRVGVAGEDSEWIKNVAQNSYAEIDFVHKPTYHSAFSHVCHESPDLINIIGDEQKEMVAFSNGYLSLGIPTSKDGDDWHMLPISEKDETKFTKYSHGLGAGDINMDGLVDVIERSGWWEQPENWDRSTPWKYHYYPFSSGTGGGQMFAFDVDGDGDNDVVTALDGHGYGLSWFEQIAVNNKIDFKEYKIMTDKPEDNPYGVSFSQLHAMSCADIDNDGLLDVVTGKCYYAHNGRDPGAEDPAVLYWFKTKRNTDGTVEFIPHKIDDDSGVGRQITTGDLNKDDKIDIVVSNKKGVFAFIQN